MARRENPLDPSEGPLQTFAHDLRALRQKSGLTYRELAVKAGYSRTTLADAASGRSLPTMEVVRAFVQVCGGDQAEWSRRWQEVSAALSTEHARDVQDAPPADRHLRELLAAVRQYWIDAELRHALDSTGRLPLRLVEHTEPPRPVPETTTILQLFQRSAQLLILGEPGVGKSLLVLELTRQLAEAWPRDPAQPVPVVVPLSSWAKRRGALDGWLVEELFRLYSVDRKLGREWVRSRRVLPLLDGLDEVSAGHREACVAAINDYRHRRGAVYPLVVSCRTEVYRSLANPLRARRTVEVRRLSVEDVRRHLRAAGPELAGVRSAVADDPRLAELVTIPLFLAMISYAYRGRVPSTEFFHDYVLRRLRNEFPAKPELGRRVGGEPERQVLHWLGWLARAMRERDETVFQPDLMQPDLLPGRAGRWLLPPRFAILVGVLAAGVFGTITGLLVDTISAVGTNRPGSGITAGLLEGGVVGLACAAQCRRPDIEPTRPPRPALTTLVRGFGWGVLGAALGAVAGLWFGTMGATATLGTPLGLLAVGLCGWLLGGAIGGATLGALSGIALGTVSGLHAEPDVYPARPGAGMRDTRRVTMTVGTTVAVAGTTAYGLHFGLALGTVVALRIGGAAYLRHQLLRRLLAHRGLIPRHLLTFLHNAHTAVLLTEVGGGYKFTHPLLHDYFRAWPTTPSAPRR